MKILSTLAARFRRDETGGTLVEFAVVLSIFMLLIFGLIDFARLSFSNVMAEKATETAVRMAVVRAPVCDGIPAVNQRGIVGALSLDLPNGTLCTERNGLCHNPGEISCLGTSESPTSAEIWSQIQPLLPVNTQQSNLRFVYHFDENMNRVGAPYSPVVSVELADLQFDFITPLGAFAALAGSQSSNDPSASFVFPSMSASLPAEDLK